MADPLAPYLPTNELVAQTWLSERVAGLTPSMVATALPDDPTKWADLGFVQVQAIPGARADIDLPEARKPIVQVDYWACAVGSAKPQWRKAARLVELVRLACEQQTYGRPLLTLPASYLGARVQAVYAIDEASRVLDDPSGYARFTQDLAVDWVRA